MSRSIRPVFEKLERREVFSVAAVADFRTALATNVLPYLEHDNVYRLSSPSGLVATTYGRGVATGDFNNDGIPDLAAHNALFSQAGDQQAIIAVLIGLIHAEKNQDIEVENDETHLAALDLNDLYLFGDTNGDGDVDAADHVTARRAIDSLIARTTR